MKKERAGYFELCISFSYKDRPSGGSSAAPPVSRLKKPRGQELRRVRSAKCFACYLHWVSTWLFVFGMPFNVEDWSILSPYFILSPFLCYILPPTSSCSQMGHYRFFQAAPPIHSLIGSSQSRMDTTSYIPLKFSSRIPHGMSTRHYSTLVIDPWLGPMRESLFTRTIGICYLLKTVTGGPVGISALCIKISWMSYTPLGILFTYIITWCGYPKKLICFKSVSSLIVHSKQFAVLVATDVTKQPILLYTSIFLGNLSVP